MESGYSSGQVDNGLASYSAIVSRLYDLDLITWVEKQHVDGKVTSEEVKAEIYEFLSKKDSQTATKILQVVRLLDGSEKATKEGDGSSPLKTVHKNPLQIDMIVKGVLGFLNLKNIKNCRRVCKKWDAIAEPLLRRRTKIVFHRSSQNRQKNRNPRTFNELFRNSRTNVPFTSFSFSSWDGKDGWTVAEMTEFFQQRGHEIEELEFHNLMLINTKNEKVDDYDISHWIRESPIQKLIIDCFESFNGPSLTVSLYELKDLKQLRLRNCGAAIREGSLIHPVKLELEYVMFYREEREVDPCHINDYIDFKKTRDILIQCSEEESTVILDLKDCVDINELALKECTIVNWGISNCSVNRLELVDVPFLEKTRMKITELHFQNSSIDLAALPDAIEKLNFNCTGNIEMLCSEPIALPNLKGLYLSNRNNLLVLSHFVNCANLVDIHISNSNGDRTMMTLTDWIPRSVKRLKLAGDISFDGETLELDILVLERCSFLNGATILTKIKPKVLVMTWNPGYEINDAAALFRHQFSRVDKFYIGPFHWPTNSFSKSMLAMYVDQESKYYVFENQRGRSIASNEFHSIDFCLK